MHDKILIIKYCLLIKELLSKDYYCFEDINCNHEFVTKTNLVK